MLKDAVYSGWLGIDFPLPQSSSFTGRSSSGLGSGVANGSPLVSVLMTLVKSISHSADARGS